MQLEFLRGLVQLVVEKLCHDIDEIATDDHLFAHMLDESLSFEQELRETFRYPIAFPSALTVLTQAQYLMKWLLAEENCGFLCARLSCVAFSKFSFFFKQFLPHKWTP